MRSFCVQFQNFTVKDYVSQITVNNNLYQQKIDMMIYFAMQVILINKLF